MEKFKSSLKKRLNFAVGFNLLIVGIIVLIFIYYNMMAVNSGKTTNMIHSFQVGIFIGIQVVALIYISKYRKALKNQGELRKLYIEENDERTKLIEDKIGCVGFRFSLGMIATAVVISGFFNRIIFITLCGVLVFMIFVMVFLKSYYKNKF